MISAVLLKRRMRLISSRFSPFTDLVIMDDASGEVRTTKTPSTPANQAEGVLAGLKDLGIGTEMMVDGIMELTEAGVVTNAVTATALRFAPPLTVSRGEIDEVVAALRGVLA